MSYPQAFVTRLGSIRVTAVFQTAFLSVSLIRNFYCLAFKDIDYRARQLAKRINNVTALKPRATPLFRMRAAATPRFG